MKRLIISESEKQTILSQHRKVKLSEESNAPDRYKTATCQGLQKGGSCKDDVLKAQIRMNDNCPSDILTQKLVEDGIHGPKTQIAFNACLPKLKPELAKSDKNSAGGNANASGGNANANGGNVNATGGNADASGGNTQSDFEGTEVA